LKGTRCPTIKCLGCHCADAHCHIPYPGPYFPSLLSPSFPLCMLYFSRISPATSVHHLTWYPALRTLQSACTPTPKSSDLRTSGTCPDIFGLLSPASHPDFQTYIGSRLMSRSISDTMR
jgi:hypothetical protein